MPGRHINVGHIRAVNVGLLDTYQLKSGNTILDAHILSVERDKNEKLVVHVRYVHAENQERKISVDRVVLCTGFLFDKSALHSEILPQFASNEKFPQVSPIWESVNQPNMFFVGNLMHGLDYEKTFSAFIHGFRYNARILAQIIATKYYNQHWPSISVEVRTEEFVQSILERVNKSSSLYQQPGFIGDVIGYDNIENIGQWYQDVPMKLVEAEGWNNYDEFWTLVLDYGWNEPVDPFEIQRFPHSKGGKDSTFLHPILRHYREGRIVAEHHVSQDLENDWRGDRFECPLRSFLEYDLKGLLKL